MIAQRLRTLVNFTVSIQIGKLQVTGLPYLRVGNLHIILVGMVGYFIITGEQTFDVVSPNVTNAVTFIVITQLAGSIVIFGNPALAIP